MTGTVIELCTNGYRDIEFQEHKEEVTPSTSFASHGVLINNLANHPAMPLATHAVAMPTTRGAAVHVGHPCCDVITPPLKESLEVNHGSCGAKQT